MTHRICTNWCGRILFTKEAPFYTNQETRRTIIYAIGVTASITNCNGSRTAFFIRCLSDNIYNATHCIRTIESRCSPLQYFNTSNRVRRNRAKTTLTIKVHGNAIYENQRPPFEATDIHTAIHSTVFEPRCTIGEGCNTWHHINRIKSIFSTTIHDILLSDDIHRCWRI